jgi:hypothetical protein
MKLLRTIKDLIFMFLGVFCLWAMSFDAKAQLFENLEKDGVSFNIK